MLSVREEHHGSQWDLRAVRKGEKGGRGSQKSSGVVMLETGVERNYNQEGLVGHC